MSEHIIDVTDGFIESYGQFSKGEIVRCRDCKYKDEPWNCAAPYYVEQNGFCAWGEKRES